MAYAEKVYKVKDGKRSRQFTWRARYVKPDGKPDSASGFPSKATAETWGEEQEARIRAGTWIDPALAGSTFGAWAKEWMGMKVPRGRTVGFRWYLLNSFVLPRWEDTALNTINWLEVDAWQQSIPAGDDIRRNAVTLMSQILTGAVDIRPQRLLINPLFGRRRTKATPGTASAAPAPKAAMAAKDKDGPPPSPAAAIRLAERLGPAMGVHILTTAFSGLRWGEGVGLHRDNALLVREEPDGRGVFRCPVLWVHPKVGELAEYQVVGADGKKARGVRLVPEPPKNSGSVRQVDLPPFLALLLRYHLADWPHDYVFCTPSGKFWRRNHWSKHLRPAADGRPAWRGQGAPPKEAWEPIWPGLDMRALRRLHDSLQAQIGVKRPLEFEQAGHRQPGIKSHYQRPTPAMRRERLAGLQEVFEEAMGELGWESLWGRVSVRKGSPWR